MSLTLYQVTDEYLELARKLQDSELPSDVITDTLEGAKYPIEEKGRTIATVVANINAERAAIGEAIEKMNAREEVLANRVEHIKNYLLMHMVRADIQKITHPLFTIAVRKNPVKVVVDDPSAVPEEFYGPQKPPPPREISRTLIKAAIEAGKEVPGAHITQDARLEIKA